MKPRAEKPQHSAETIGVTAALAAYILWGLAPIYFKQILSVAPLEVIAHRILWSIPLLAGFLWWRKGSSFLQDMRLPPRTVLVLLVSGILVVTNWLIFVWAVMNNQILATSLGYFTGPLVNFMLGFLFLKERLTLIQTIGVVIAAAGTVYLGWFLGTPPWISLSLAFSFGAYGLVRKMLGVGPMVGLLWETLLLALPALLYVAWLGKNGTLSFAGGGLRLDLLLILAGPVTVLPLVWFNVACPGAAPVDRGLFPVHRAIVDVSALGIRLWRNVYLRPRGRLRLHLVCLVHGVRRDTDPDPQNPGDPGYLSIGFRGHPGSRLVVWLMGHVAPGQEVCRPPDFPCGVLLTAPLPGSWICTPGNCWSFAGNPVPGTCTLSLTAWVAWCACTCCIKTRTCRPAGWS